MRNAAIHAQVTDWRVEKDGSVTLELTISGSCSNENGATAVIPRGTKAEVRVGPQELAHKGKADTPSIRTNSGDHDPRLSGKL